MSRIKVELTEREAYFIDKALGYMTLDEEIGYMTLDEEIGEGEYPDSWLCLYRQVNRKLRKAGADVEEEQ